MDTFFYWLFVITVIIIIIIFLFDLNRIIKEKDSTAFFACLLILGIFGSIQYAFVTNIGYSEKEVATIDHTETTMMFDDEEAIVKYKNRRWEITEHGIYIHIIDNNFYIEKIENYNIFGYSTGFSYNIRIYDKK